MMHRILLRVLLRLMYDTSNYEDPSLVTFFHSGSGSFNDIVRLEKDQNLNLIYLMRFIQILWAKDYLERQRHKVNAYHGCISIMPQSQQHQGQQRRQHHYFLFRHCVRSTGQEFKVHLWQDDGALPVSGSSYGPVQTIPIDVFFEQDDMIPNWNVPPNACTQQALDMVQATGKWLIQSNVFEGNKIKMDLLSDMSDRDIDTAYRLSLGIHQALIEQQEQNDDDLSRRTVVDGWNEISYFHDLFQDPLPQQLCNCTGSNINSNNSSTSTSKTHSTEDMIHAIQKRIKTILPPMTISDALARMKTLLGGFGPNAEMMLNHLDTSQEALTLIHQDNNSNNNNNKSSDGETTKLYPSGVIEILKLFGQFLFYSRAGGIEPTYLPNITTVQDVYQFLALVHWSRSVWSVGNPQAAASGAVHAQIMLHALRYGSVVSTEWKHHSDQQRRTDSSRQQEDIDHDDYHNDDYDTHVTIVVGHDGNLDDMATALGIQWELQHPYISSSSSTSKGDYLPTPPLSALHVVRSFTMGYKTDDNERSVPVDHHIDVSILFPIYSNGTSWSNSTNAFNGILTSREVLWDINHESNNGVHQTAIRMDTKLVPRGTLSRLHYDGVMDQEHDLVNYLQHHIESTIQQYPGASSCWEATGTLLQDLHDSSPSSKVSASWWDVTAGLVVVVVPIMVLCLMVGVLLGCIWTRWCLQRHGRRLNHNRRGMTVVSQYDDQESHVVSHNVVGNDSNLSSATVVVDLVDERRSCHDVELS
jgi:hypothetical protein